MLKAIVSASFLALTMAFPVLAKSVTVDRSYFVVPISQKGTETRVKEGAAVYVMRFVNIGGRINLCGGYDFATPLLFVTNRPFVRGDDHQYRARQTYLRQVTHMGKFLNRSDVYFSGTKIKTGLSKLKLMRAVRAKTSKSAFKGTKSASQPLSKEVTVPGVSVKGYVGQRVNCVATRSKWVTGAEKVRPVIVLQEKIKVRLH